jgi:hypothetical protein
MSELATEASMLDFTPVTGPLKGTSGVDHPGVTHTPSTTSMAKNQKLCVGQLIFAFSLVMPCPCTFSGHTFVAGGGVLKATALKSQSDNMSILRKNDMGNCSGSWVNNVSGATVPCSCQVRITDAGQVGVVGS